MARRSPTPAPKDGSPPAQESAASIAQDLNYQQARTALELVLAELQTSDLEVEQMADLYRRGLQYLSRCEAILERVEQEVLLWQPTQPEQALEPLPPAG
ncbi:MAG: exodeoxyribonuclease VII small subunit [Synechococcus sp.]|nr:exodeoxyribonuclease VII small subunit [Synechococcus sp.]